MLTVLCIVAGLAAGWFWGWLWSVLTRHRDPYTDEPTPSESFEQIDEAVHDLKERGWVIEICGNKDGTFVYYKFIAPAPGDQNVV